MVELPRVMRDIIREVAGTESGIELIGETSGDVDLTELVHATRADVVIMGLENTALPEAGQRLLNSHPSVRVLGVVADGRHAVLYELREYKRILTEVSPSELVNALREVRPERPSPRLT